MEKVIWKWNSLYSGVHTAPQRIIDIWGGRGRGGSHFGTDYFLCKLISPGYFRGYFIRRTFNDIRDSLWRDLKDRIDEHNLDIEDFAISENEMRITCISTGNTITSKGVVKEGSRTGKMKSLAGATDVLIEEADEIEEADFDQLDLSLRTIKANKVQIIRIFNPPPKHHWIWRDYILEPSNVEGYFKARVRSDSNILSIFATYKSNTKNLDPATIERMEQHRTRKPEYYWTQVAGYISEGAKGRIFSGWNQITTAEYDAIEEPEIYGVDFGFSSHATAVVACKAVREHRYYRLLIYEPGLTTRQLACRMYDCGIRSNSIIIGDTGGGGDRVMAELRAGMEVEGYPELVNGFSVFPANKGGGSVLVGINRLRELEIHVCEDSQAMWREYLEYRWALDKNKEPTDSPVKLLDDALDAARYIESARGIIF